MNNKPQEKTGLPQTIGGLLVFLLPLVCLTTRNGVSISSFTFLIAAAVLFQPARAALLRVWPQVRWVVLGFGIWFVFNAALVLLRAGTPLSELEKPARMFFAFTALLVVLVLQPSRRALWWGIVAGLVIAVPIVAHERFLLLNDRPGGPLNPITFGDQALMLALMAIAAATELRTARHAALLGIGAIAGIAACVISGTRGAWLALPAVGVVFLANSRLVRNRVVLLLAGVAGALALAAFAVPETGVQERVDQGLADVRNYFNGTQKFTNVGTRLELWKAASILIGEHPWTGQDLTSAHRRVRALAAEGRLDHGILDLPHFQNDAVQVLVAGGMLGLLAWLPVLVAPMVFFGRQLRRSAQPGRQQVALALAGLVVVTSYICFGLTEVIFWSVGGALLYALLVFLLMGLCLNAKDNDGK